MRIVPSIPFKYWPPSNLNPLATHVAPFGGTCGFRIQPAGRAQRAHVMAQLILDLRSTQQAVSAKWVWKPPTARTTML